MKITKVSFNRKFNLGNYETLDAGMEAELTEKDNPQEMLTILKDNVEMWFIGQQRKKPQTPQCNTPGGPNETVKPKQVQPQTEINVDFLSPAAREHVKQVVDRGDYHEVHVKFLKDLEEYGKISSELKRNGGVFVSAGKDSHWKIPKAGGVTS